MNDLAAALRRDVETLATAIGPRHLWRYDALQATVQFVTAGLGQSGCPVQRQTFEAAGREVCNLEVELPGTDRAGEIVIVGAHYDSAVFGPSFRRFRRRTDWPEVDERGNSLIPGTPGANDNATGVATVLALVRARGWAGGGRPHRRTIRFVGFVNEEPPFFQGPHMGSVVYARRCRERGEKIVAAITPDTLGYYTQQPCTQRYPFPYNLRFGTTGNFVAFLSNRRSRKLLRRVEAMFRSHSDFPTLAVAVPAVIPRVGWSDDWAFWQEGYPALTVTDTAFLRSAHYHQASDTPEHLDFAALARVVTGLEHVVEDLGNGN